MARRLALALLLSQMLATAVERQADLLIVGGTESGCAAAVQAARMGVRSILLVNDLGWLGGQFSAEGLMAFDENRGPEGYGHGVPFPRAGLFAEVIGRIEQANLAAYGVARPGNTRVITTCRPEVAERAFRELLEPYVDRGQFLVLSGWAPTEVEVVDGRLTTVTFEPTAGGDERLTVAAPLTIDASDWGDIVRLSGAPYRVGPETKDEFGEPKAPASRDRYPRTDLNPITYCMVLEETDHDAAIPEPPGYDARNYEGLPYPNDPAWIYASRRLVDRVGFPQIQAPDTVLLCFPAFDYPLDVLPGCVAAALEANAPGASELTLPELTRAQRQIVFDDAKRHSLGFLYYLQSREPPGRTGPPSFRRLKLVDSFGTADHLPPKPYVRESLHLDAMYVLRQQDTFGHDHDPSRFADAMPHDGVVAWQFEYDFHPTKRNFIAGGDPDGPWHAGFRANRSYGGGGTGRAMLPLRSLIPRAMDGLMVAQKSLGYTSQVSAALRLHDQSVAVGQAVGAAAAVALQHHLAPRKIPYDRGLLTAVWAGLESTADGAVPVVLWPYRDLDPSQPAFPAINQLAIRGGLPQAPDTIDFEPDAPATEAWRDEVIRRSAETKLVKDSPAPPQGELTRGEFCRQWWAAIAALPDAPFVRQSDIDADADGIPDFDDPLPFTPGRTSWATFRLTPESDGLPEVRPGARQFNFSGPGEPVEGWVTDTGQPFEEACGYGWSRDISANNRRRGRVPEAVRDTFLFTRSHDTWELAVPDGHYSVTLCIGDSGHEQFGQNVTVEGQTVFRDLKTRSGRFREATVKVDVADGRLTIAIGLPGSETNTCLTWVQIEP